MKIVKWRYYIRVEILRRWAVYFWYYPKDWQLTYVRGRYLFIGPIEIDML